MKRRIRWLLPALIALAAASLAATTSAGIADNGDKSAAAATTPIQHLVVIFQENVSFDHYFATYPNATNPPNEPASAPRRDTPIVNGLNDAAADAGNANAAQPFRLDRSQFETCDQDHNYKDEQAAGTPA